MLDNGIIRSLDLDIFERVARHDDGRERRVGSKYADRLMALELVALDNAFTRLPKLLRRIEDAEDTPAVCAHHVIAA